MPHDALQVTQRSGFCRNCRREPIVPHRKWCAICIQKRQEKYWRCVLAGLCPSCQKAPTADGKIRCVTCSDKYRQDSAERYRRVKAKGLCTYCRHHHALPHRELCFDCFQKKARLDRARREQKKAAWLAWSLVVVVGFGHLLLPPPRARRRTHVEAVLGL
jgi:hypothetical protein